MSDMDITSAVLPDFNELGNTIELALQNPAKALEYAKLFQTQTFQLYIQYENISQWNETNHKIGMDVDSILAFKDSVLLFLDRFVEYQSFILKGLCQLCVVGGDLGKCSLAIVSSVTKYDNKLDVTAIILQVITPLLDVIETLPSVIKHNVLTSLSKLPQIPEVSGSLQPVIHNVIVDIKANPWKSQYLELFKTICLNEDNQLDIAHYSMAEFLMDTLLNYESRNGPLYLNMSDIERITEIISVVSVCLVGIDVKVTSQFNSKVLVPNLKHLIGDRQGTNRLSFEQSKFTSDVIKLANSISQNSPMSLDELSYGYHLFDLLIVPVKEQDASPLVLSSALEGLSFMLKSPVTSGTYIPIFCEEVDSTSLLVYLEEAKRDEYLSTWKEITNDVIYSVSKFIATILEIAQNNSMLLEFAEKMFERGLNINVLEAFSYGLGDSKIRAELVKIISLFPQSWIDSAAINKMLDLLSSNLTEYCADELECMVVALHKRLDIVPLELVTERACTLLCATLKVTNTRKFESLQEQCVRLLLDIANTETGRLHLRTPNITLALRKALKYEQDYSHFYCKDLNVELCWIGASSQFLYSCMFDVYHLRYDRRQFYRVIRALERCVNGADGQNNEKSLTLEELCNEEVNDFYNTEIGEAEVFRKINKDQQQQLFVALELPDKILAFLAPLYSLYFTKLYQREKKYSEHSEYWAGLLKAEKLDCESLNFVPKFDWKLNYSSAFDDDPSIVELSITEISPNVIVKPTRKLASFAIGQAVTMKICKDQDDIFHHILPPKLLNKVWINECRKHINPAFTISSFLRILYGLMGDDVSPLVRNVIKDKFKGSEFIRKMIKLATCTSILDVNIGGKLIKTFIRALEFDRHVKAESLDAIVVYDIISRFLMRICKLIHDCVCSVHVNWLNEPAIQYLILQVFGFYTLLCRQVPLIKFSNTLEIQRFFVERCFNRFIPESVLSLVMTTFFQIITFERSSSSGTFIAHLYDVKQLELIRNHALNITVGITINTPNTLNFYVLNEINKQRRNDKLSLRSTLINSLLYQLYLSSLQYEFQTFISRNRIERVIHYDRVWIASNCLDGIEECFIAITSRSIYFVVLKKDTFKVLLSMTKYTLHSIDDGILYVIERGEDWVVFTTKYVNYDGMKHFVNGINYTLLLDGAAKLLEEVPIFITLCKYDDHIIMLARNEVKIHLFNIDFKELVIELHKDGVSDDKIVLKAFIQPKLDEQVVTKSEVSYLALSEQLKINKITEIRFNSELQVTLFCNDEDDVEVHEVTFISDSSRERFKRSLARAISDEPWQRQWD